MPLPFLVGASFGANLLGGLLKARSERRRQQQLRRQLFSALAPIEGALLESRFGSQSLGNIESAVTQRTLGGLAARGVLNSSMAAPAVAEAVAPIENQRQQRVQGLLERLVAARQSILEGTQAPGYGAAFGESFGQSGDLLAYLSGRQYGDRNQMGNYNQGEFMGPPEQPAPPQLGYEPPIDYQSTDPYAEDYNYPRRRRR